MRNVKVYSVRMVASALVLASPLFGQVQDADQLKELKRQVEQMQANFERVVQEQKHQIEALQKQLDKLQAQQTNAPPAAAIAAAKPTELPAAPPPAQSWSPTEPIRVGRGGTYADLGLVGTFAVGGSTASDIEGGTQLGGHDPNQNGFTVQGVELNLQGAVDPYFRGNANIALVLDSGGETQIELEEAWLETISLPANLQVRAGQYLSEFGRINTQHPHTWAFVDTPLVNGRMFGEDGLRNPGARLSWLAPTPFYSELFFGVQDSQGGTASSFRDDRGDEPYLGRLWSDWGVQNMGDMLYTVRYATSFDLTDTQTLLAGLSAAFGPNDTGANTDTQIYGVDLYWKWKSPHANAGFPFVSFQSEAMLRRLDAGAFSNDFNGNSVLDPGEDVFGDGLIHDVPAETLTDWGFYSQLLYGFRKGWVAGLRGEYTGRTERAAYEVAYGDDPDRLPRWRVAPNLTWYPSEFSKIRLQYNYDDREEIGIDHSVWLQFEFLLGAHAAHKF